MRKLLSFVLGLILCVGISTISQAQDAAVPAAAAATTVAEPTANDQVPATEKKVKKVKKVKKAKNKKVKKG